MATLAAWPMPVIADRNCWSRAGSASRAANSGVPPPLASLLAVQALQEAEGDQGVQKVTTRAWLQAEAALERLQVLGTPRQLGENADFHGAEQRLRGPEAKADLEDVLWGGVIAPVRCSLSSGRASEKRPLPVRRRL